MIERKQRWQRISAFGLALLLLAAVYLFQQFNLLHWILSLFGAGAGQLHPYADFVFNKTVRLVLNDLACFGLIYALFAEKKYLRVAFWVFLFEILVLLPIYLILKLGLEGDSEISSPLFSQIHRLIVNPMLMLLLIFGFAYQRFQRNQASS